MSWSSGGDSDRNKRRLVQDVARRMVENEAKQRRIDHSESSNEPPDTVTDTSPSASLSEVSLGPDVDLQPDSEVDEQEEIGLVSCFDGDHSASLSEVSEVDLQPDSETDEQEENGDEQEQITSEAEEGPIFEYGEMYDSSSCDSSGGVSDECDSVSDKAPDLFQGSAVSSRDCSIALLSIMHKHSLTYSAVTDILNLLSLSLPSPNTLPTSQYSLMKKYVNYQADTKVHRCCGNCTKLLVGDSSCSVADCRRANIPDSTFVEICLDKQIKTLFSGNIATIIFYGVPLVSKLSTN